MESMKCEKSVDCWLNKKQVRSHTPPGKKKEKVDKRTASDKREKSRIRMDSELAELQFSLGSFPLSQVLSS
jgi:hypothetical protein